MMNTLLSYLLCSLVCLLLISVPVSAQQHLQPPHGGDGLPGLLPESFVISWLGAENAYGYEYLITDNELCYAGCGGDTRQGVAFDTFAVIHKLPSDRDYYWITRVVYNDGSATDWSLPSNFKTVSPETSKLTLIAPNPVSDQLRIIIDWGADPNTRHISLQVFDRAGRPVLGEFQISRNNSDLRFGVWKQSVTELPAGMYFAVFARDNAPGATVIQKVLVQP